MSDLGQLARFAAVATVNLGVNLAVLAVGVRVLALPSRLGTPGLWLSQAAAVLAATSLGYVLHARFTFTEARRKAGVGRVGRYGAVAGGALAVQVPLFAVLMAGLGRLWPSAPWLPYVANVLGGVLIFLGSFALNRAWTFQADRRGTS
jgi:putative flippase GtrA